LQCVKQIGSIAPGKAAGMIAVACDPLRDIDCLRSIRGVIKAGKSIALD
jgi:imidazolonepropionase-like amidohydrolase